MIFSPDTFLAWVKQTVTGGGTGNSSTGPIATDGGFLRDMPLNFMFAGSTLGSTAVKFAQIAIPRDYDEANDVFQLHMTGSTATTTTLTMQSKFVSTLIPGSTSVFVSATKSTIIDLPSVSGAVFGFTIDMSGLGLKRDSVVTISTVASGQSPLIAVAGGFVTYASDLVAFNMYDTELVNNRLQPIRG